MIGWLDAHAGAAQAIVAAVQVLTTVILLAITAYYAAQTRQQATAAQATLDEMQRAREAQARAYVTLELWPWDRNMTLFDLAIRNHGPGTARDIRVTFEPDFRQPQYGGGTINELEFLRDIPFLGPHDELLMFLANRQWLEAEDLPKEWSGYTTYTDDTGPQRTPFRLNLKDLQRLQCMLPYGEPSFAPPIRRGWGRLQEPDKHAVIGRVNLS